MGGKSNATSSVYFDRVNDVYTARPARYTVVKYTASTFFPVSPTSCRVNWTVGKIESYYFLFSHFFTSGAKRGKQEQR
jgi:hypothetical protein